MTKGVVKEQICKYVVYLIPTHFYKQSRDKAHCLQTPFGFLGRHLSPILCHGNFSYFNEMHTTTPC